MHIAVLNANVDRSAFARGWPDDAEKMIAGLQPLRPDWHYRSWQAWDGELPPQDDDSQAWVITGSVASVNEEAPWMLALEHGVRARHAQCLPTAGLCFGHQLIAKALGGRVGASAQGWRLGVAITHFTSCEGTAEALAWMQSPSDARVLGGDAFTPHAALQAGEHILTTQYHPELSRAFLLGVLDDFGDEWPAEQVARARQQFEQPVDSGHFMRWLVQFLEAAAP